MAKVKFDTFTGSRIGRIGAANSPWSKYPACDTNNAWKCAKDLASKKRKKRRLALIAKIAKKD